MAKRDSRIVMFHAAIMGLEKETGAKGFLEYAFAKPRRWRFDAAFPQVLVAVEVEGAVWTYGRHTRASGFLRDKEKYNTAALAGWCVLRYTWDEIKNGKFFEEVESAIKSRTFKVSYQYRFPSWKNL